MGRFVSGDQNFDSGIPGNTVSFNDVTNKPTTLAGYGITDGAVASNIEFNTLVNKPTSLAGYGITDLVIDFNEIINKPDTLAGYGIIDGGSGGTGGPVSFTNVIDKPTTITGYGITDGVTTSQLNTAVNTAVNDTLAAGDLTVINNAVDAAVTTKLDAAMADGGQIANIFVRKIGGDVLVGNYAIEGSLTTSGEVTAFGDPLASGGAVSTTYVKRVGGDTLTGDYDINGNLTTSGNIVATGDVSAFSDERLKKDWTDLPTDFLEQLSTIKHGNYTRIDTDQKQVGVSAQDLQLVLPNAVITTDNSMLAVTYGNAALVAAVELAKEVVSLKKIIADLIVMVNEKNAL